MNLQSYIADIINFLNNIFIPFMLGMAFLVFVINVFRFFIVGGANPDSQAKAKSLAVYGVGAFVFIIIFWGIVNLFTSSLGLTRLGTADNTCFDYDVLCNSDVNLGTGPTTRGSVIGTAGNFEPTGPTTRPVTLSEPTGPTTRPSIVGPDGFTDDSSGPTTRPNNAPTDYSSVTTPVITTVTSIFPDLPSNLLVDQFAIIGEDRVSDAVRANTARAFADASLITDLEFIRTLDAINDVRAQNNFPRIEYTAADPDLTSDLSAYKNNVDEVSQIINDYYGEGSFSAADTLDKLFNTDYPYEERLAAVDDVVELIQPDDQATTADELGPINQLRFSIESAHSIEGRHMD